MDAATITAAVDELRVTYGERVRVAQDGARTLVGLDSIALPAGCQPARNDFMLLFEPAAAKPQHFIRPGQTLSNGKPPKNSSTVAIAGESWLTFSYNVPYREGDSLVRFVAALQVRFGRDD
jgi:hypothetical protein